MKRIVVMGATSGLGREVAELFARGGWTVGVCGRSADKLEELQRQFPELVHHSVIDVTRPDAPGKLRDLISRMGGMDIYLHASGICNEDAEPPVTKHDVQVARTNVVGFTALVSTAYRYLLEENPRGQLAAISSVAGVRGIGMLAAYSASKSYQQEYLSALRQLANKECPGLCITDLRPGWTETPLLRKGRRYPMLMSRDRVVARIVRAILLRRTVCTIDWRWRLLADAGRLVPNCLWERIPFKPSAP